MEKDFNSSTSVSDVMAGILQPSEVPTEIKTVTGTTSYYGIMCTTEEYQMAENHQIQYENQGWTKKQSINMATKLLKDYIKKYRNKALVINNDDVEKNKRIQMFNKLMVETDNNGYPKTTPVNYQRLIAAVYKHTFSYNVWDDRIYIDDEPLSDNNLIEIENELGQQFGDKFEQPRKIYNAVYALSQKNIIHPVKEYLESLVWDGKKRAASMLITYLGAEDNNVNRWITTMFLYAAVRRIYDAGCKFDNMLILQGAQGAGKTMMCQRLVKNKWYSENIDITTKDAMQEITTSWFVIMDELASMTKKETNDVKNFLAKTQDTFRAAYAKESKTHKRHCVFIGSTNEDTFLKDNTAIEERRYWIVPCTRSHRTNIVYKEFTDEVVDQIWAEIFTLYKANPEIEMNMDKEMYDEYMKCQRQFKVYQDDPTFQYLDDVLNREYSLNENMCFDYTEDFAASLDNKETTGTYTHKGKLNRVSLTAVSMLLTEKHITTYRGLFKRYADWNSEMWEYKKMSPSGNTNSSATWCLVRRDDNHNTEPKTNDANSLFMI